ncbi:ImuA family protein [Sphingomonas sp. Leaf339]|uniref:ImuA family protein n=1 Tax=Sphingomonas sp. Leaf339 TaxID=1736343 RepID=UPI001F4628B6|nr:hypothetical protein [Sphingomonas sp. Leaf339]
MSESPALSPAGPPVPALDGSRMLIARLRWEVAGTGTTQTDDRAADAWLTTGLAPAQLHEIYAAEAADGTAAIGFAVALALAAGALPVLWVRTEKDERQAGRLHAGGLAELGLPPDSIVLVVAADEAALLRVAADAARCSGLGMLLVESRGRAPGLDLTATRRLMLAAEASGVTVLSVRIDAAPVPSAAATRWGVAAMPSVPLEAEAPGLPAFDVESLRRRGGPAGARCRVEWNRENRSFDPCPIQPAAQTALAGSGLPLVAGGAAARDAPASVRRSG